MTKCMIIAVDEDLMAMPAVEVIKYVHQGGFVLNNEIAIEVCSRS